MAQYIGRLKGGRQAITRLGHKTTGLQAEANGWNIGAKIWINWNEEKQRDEVVIYKTSGSGHRKSDEVIATFYE